MVTMTVSASPEEISPPRGEVVVSLASDRDEWNAFVERHRSGTVDHLWEWRRVFERAFGHSSEYLIARRDGGVVGVLPLVIFNSRLFGRQIVSLPMLNYGGLLVDDQTAIGALIAAARELALRCSAKHVELRHPAPLTMLPARQHKVSMRLELPESPEALWQGLDRKVRNQVRKAQKSDLTTATGGADLVPTFYKVFAENMRDLGTPVYSQRLFSEVLEQFPTRATITLVHLGPTPVAAALTLRFRDSVLVPWASALKGHRHLCPNMLLYWTLLQDAIAQGARVFDFGRSSVDGGTYQFKQQWGATPEPQFWEYILLRGDSVPDHSPSNDRFSLAIEAGRRLPLWIANTAGPHIVRNIP